MKSKRPVAVASKPSGDQTPGRAPSAEVLAAALAATNRRDTPTSPARSAALVNSQAEVAREKAVADINMSVGWVPGVGTVVNGLSLLSDFADFTLAAMRGDTADMGDEIQDMAVDVVGMIPVIGAPVAATIHRARVPVPTPVNHSPSPVNDSFAVTENTQLTGNVLTNDTDADGDTLSVTVAQAPSHGSLALNSDGSFTYTPAENYYGADTFSYTVADGHGGTAVGTTSITVNAHPPVIDQTQPYSIDETDPVTGTIRGHFNVTHDKALTYHVGTGPDPTLGAFELDEQTGEWIFTPNPRTRVLAASFAPNSPAAVKLTFAVVATDGVASTAPIAVSEQITGVERAALALPADTIPVLSFVDARTGNAYVFAYRGDLFSSPDDQTVSYLAAVIHADGSYSTPDGSNAVSGLVSQAFVIGDTTFVTSQTGGDESSFQTHLSTLGPDGLTPLGDPIPGYARQPLTVADTTYLVTQTGTYASGYQTQLTVLRPDGVTSTQEVPGAFYDRTIVIGDTTYLVTDVGTDEWSYRTQLTTLGPDGVTSTTSIPGSFYGRTLVVGDTTYLVTRAGTYDTGYQTHLNAVEPNGVTSTTSIPGEFYEDSSGYSIVKGDITYVVTQSGTYETGYDTNVTALGPDGGAPTVTIPGWAWRDPIIVGDTTYLLVPTQSGNVTQAVALTSAGAIPVGSIPGELSGDPIVVGDTTYFISHIGDSGATETWQSVVTTLAPIPGGVTVIGDPIPGYRWAVRPVVVGDTTYLVTETWNSSVGYETHLTALRPDGVAPIGTAILGTVSGDPFVVVVGDTSYLITTARYYWNSDGTYAYTRTFLTAVEQNALTRWGDPLAGYPGIAPVTIGDTTYLVMETDDPSTGYQLQLVSVTAHGVTPIGAPASGRVNSHSDFDVIVVGDTTYLMVETPDSAGGHQTSLVKVGPSGLTAMPGTLPGHPVSAPVAVGETTYLVTQTGEYSSATTYFTVLDPQGVLQSTYSVSGELAFEPLVVVGDLTYVKTNGWKQTGEGSYSTDRVYFTAMTAAGPVSVNLPSYYGYQTISVGGTTYLMSTVYPDDVGATSDTTENYVVALTPHGPAQLRQIGNLSTPFVVDGTTYLISLSYPDDVDTLDDVTTYVITLTADGPVVSDPFPEIAPEYADPIFGVGDTTYVMTTSGIWAVGVKANPTDL
ncbi:Ig-like domain-containing protein [Mycobacterium sp. SA01]|uniref:Ig-like domain-containing protein n=1 Tax=Mycobacterium sp. SA01 TaxID=3238820 RepID=UPI00351B385A